MGTGIIFDIDGTLIDSYEVDVELYKKAVLMAAPGVEFRNSWLDYSYSTDSGILMEILEEFDLSYDDYFPAIRDNFYTLMKGHIESENNSRPIPGSIGLLNHLIGNMKLPVGIATGGWGHTARLKLESAGMPLLDVPFGSSDDAYSRKEIMQLVAGKMPASVSRFVYVGDGEWDFNATKELGWDFIGIGKRLDGKCEKWISDYMDSDLFLKYLGLKG